MNLDTFLVEPKYGSNGMAEPDVFCIFRRTPFFIEVQKSIYSVKQMKDKLNHYKDLYNSAIMSREAWQNPDKPIFFYILILSEQRYTFDRTYPFKVIQNQTFTKFLQMIKPRELNQLRRGSTSQDVTTRNKKIFPTMVCLKNV